ncbi:PREDICTED: uncharacterized protein LOC106806602 [Priapulus caudatus]|uniref:Uncharacterized protein LOC106806602 n=1 Tax=Priapulus caudatus TaxID=37621 RepID=A0ABM1DVW2_PRICU|nr:PREDICTED: uncharacterized protein LOC106806602 [Priapulus caudatus]
MFEILEAYGIPPDVVVAIRVMYENTSAVVITPEGETDAFNIDTGILPEDRLHVSDGSDIELVGDFKYLGGYTDSSHDMSMRIAQSWSALHSLQKLWKAPIQKDTKTKVFQACIETILLYGSESWTLNITRQKRLDSTYTRMLRAAYNISWRHHLTNKSLYGSLPRISDVVRHYRLALAGHVIRHDEPAGRLLLWTPDTRRGVRRPYVTLKSVIERDTGLTGADLYAVMVNRGLWSSNFVNTSPTPHGIG